MMAVITPHHPIHLELNTFAIGMHTTRRGGESDNSNNMLLST